MEILALSDIHADIERLRTILDSEPGKDLVLVAGDLTDTSENDYRGKAEQVADILEGYSGIVKAVPGNMDDESILELLVQRRINLHKDMFSFQNIDFIGFGGGRTPFDTPFEPEDEERRTVLNQLRQRTAAEQIGIVSHEPPKRTMADRTSEGEHVGSQGLRAIIDEGDIDLVLSGHIHESRTVDRLSGTTIVNPGPVNEGKYAVIEVEDRVEAELRG